MECHIAHVEALEYPEEVELAQALPRIQLQFIIQHNTQIFIGSYNLQI